MVDVRRDRCSYHEWRLDSYRMDNIYSDRTELESERRLLDNFLKLSSNVDNPEASGILSQPTN